MQQCHVSGYYNPTIHKSFSRCMRVHFTILCMSKAYVHFFRSWKQIFIPNGWIILCFFLLFNKLHNHTLYKLLTTNAGDAHTDFFEHKNLVKYTTVSYVIIYNINMHAAHINSLLINIVIKMFNSGRSNRVGYGVCI